MLQRIFPFLKRNLPQDPFLINRIFVSVYLIYNKVESYNQFIERYVISETDKDYEELGKDVTTWRISIISILHQFDNCSFGIRKVLCSYEHSCSSRSCKWNFHI
jgi:hypothetical protein